MGKDGGTGETRARKRGKQHGGREKGLIEFDSIYFSTTVRSKVEQNQLVGLGYWIGLVVHGYCCIRVRRFRIWIGVL